MKKSTLLLIVLVFFVSLIPAYSQKLVSNTTISGVCYAGDKVTRIYIPPPDEFLRKSGSKGGGSITVYYSGFTNAAKTAVEFAKSILETLLPEGTNITMIASWEKINTPGVLGNTVITGYAAGVWIDALNPRAYYPVSLAEKIAGVSLNSPEEGDLVLRINSSVNWYLGTDGSIPPNSQKYDLVTVVLHEICHGLGFFDSMNADGTVGSYGSGSIPMIYDTFLEDASGKKLTDTLEYPNYSLQLKNQLIGGQVWFTGPVLKKYTSGSKAKVYAPPVWDNGSSISHLDEESTLKKDALMTPFINMEEVIHNPGKLTTSILGDLGWINTRILHDPFGDTENNLSQIILSASIKSDTSYNRSNVGVVYSFDKFQTSDTIYMTSPGDNDSFNASVNIPLYNSELLYYFFTEDYFKRIYRSPSLSDQIRYRMFIGTDTVKPIIVHTPVASLLESADTISFNANVIDNLEVDSVYMEYKVNDGTSFYAGLIKGAADNYKYILNASQLNLTGGDSVRYRICALDKASVSNLAVLPKTGYFSFGIEDISSVVESYETDFTNAVPDFFNIGFSIYKPVNFTGYGLHSKHPYESPEDNSKSIEYTAMLRHPFKFSESGLLINYSEVVLVEPGETGSVFGSTDFYDYVIIDGSVNFGKTWFNLIDGYDSRYSAIWEDAYNSSIMGQNSRIPGTEAMLRKHTAFVKPSAKISVGDTIMLRFRLYSDPFANGWGWAIEDLKINPLVDAVEKISEINDIRLYPNPGTGIIKTGIENGRFALGKPLRFRVLNSSGTILLDDYLAAGSQGIINIQGYPSGIYFILLYFDEGIKTFKYNLIK
jgi:hypothetical protein